MFRSYNIQRMWGRIAPCEGHLYSSSQIQVYEHTAPSSYMTHAKVSFEFLNRISDFTDDLKNLGSF